MNQIDQKLRHEVAWRGDDYAAKLANKLVTVCGCGALGSNLVDSLARMGVPKIRVVDFDRIEASNVGTQVWSSSDVGAFKTEAMKRHAFKAAGVEIEAITKMLDESNVKSTFRHSQLVVDCFDNADSRRVVRDACKLHSMPCLHAGMSNDGFAEVTWNDSYKIPKANAGGDPCDVPLTRSLVLLTVGVMVEEIMNFFLAKKARMKNWTITINDLQIRETK